jgi:hypothetical protein
MAVTEALPIILDNAGLKINDVELACLLSHIEISPDIDTTEIKTMCGSVDYPGTIKWLLKATLYQSYDPAGTYEVLTEAVDGGVPVPFKVIPRRNAAEGPTNPVFTGMVVPQPVAPIMGDAGEASTLDLEWSIVGGYEASPPGTETYNGVTVAAADAETAPA